MTVGDRIKRARENACIGQTELAEKILVSKQTLYKYENNIITNIPSDKIEDIAKVLNISPATLMGWEEDTQEKLPPDIRSAARDMMDLSNDDKQLAIQMINSLAKKGREANKT